MTLILSGNTTDFTTVIRDGINLDQNREYEAALLSIDTYNSFPNISTENNVFKYSADNGTTWKNIVFDTGSYQLTAINDEIQRQMVVNGDYDSDHSTYYITLTANTSKLKSIVDITNPTYKIDFDVPSSIGPTLGFPLNSPIIGHGFNESPNIVDIIKINSILVNADIISGSYVNGFYSPVIYSFFPNVSPGYKIIERPNPSLIYYPINRSNISSIRVWLTDQNNKPVDLRGETLTVRIAIREVKSRNIKREIIEGVRELVDKKII